jgi:DNA replication protein DnaC
MDGRGNMKLVTKLVKSYLPDSEPSMVHFIADFRSWKKLDIPTLSSELTCLVCGSYDHYAVFCDPAKGIEKVRICAHGDCKSNVNVLLPNSSANQANRKRLISWESFCESSGIGDLNHAVKFEDIQQSKEKIAFMARFCLKPCGLVYMQGKSGSGKTFAAMGMCELYLRENDSCIFITQEQLFDRWLEITRGAEKHFLNRVNEVKLLLVDDFGTGEPSSGFLKYFLQLINSREQWTDRGTVITTNLQTEKLVEFCGEAIVDRLSTGQAMIFNNPSRRVKKPI